MSGSKEGSDGYVRKDIMGGFPGDTINEFTPEGRTAMQNEAWNFIRKINNWRKGNDVIAYGKLKHFMPENGLYVYERSLDGRKVVVMMNGNDHPVTVDTGLYAEILPEGTKMKDMLSGKEITITKTMEFPSRALYILE